MKVRFAVTPNAATQGGAEFADYLQRCETLGFDTLWLSDIPIGPVGDPMLSLAFAAAVTAKLKLGANVVPLGRSPAVLAKQLAQLDRLSRGRLLLSFVPGIGQPAERDALGLGAADRGRRLDDVLVVVRRWWAGHTVTADIGEFRFADLAVSPTPLQQPLEVWLGGIGPLALARVGRLADGWLTANATPTEAGAGLRAIVRHAGDAGRSIDPEHFGISVPVARADPPAATIAAMKSRRADGDLTDLLPVGADAVRELLRRHIDQGLTKFVLRCVDADDDWRAHLDWLADVVLPMQV